MHYYSIILKTKLGQRQIEYAETKSIHEAISKGQQLIEIHRKANPDKNVVLRWGTIPSI
jgi:hypothetical protein